MSHVLPQVALQRVIQEGIKYVKDNINILDIIFGYYLEPEMSVDYGQAHIDLIKNWFLTTKIPVVQAWSFNVQAIPQISIKLASEQEDESKAALGDHFDMGDISDIGVSAFVVNLDIAIHANRDSDEVMWLYYIVNYILFKRKRQAEKLGLQLHTFNATDYSRENGKMPDNIYTRFIRFRAVVENYWMSEAYLDIDDMNLDVNLESATEIE